MSSSTSSKATVRILSCLLVLSLLYIVFVPATPSEHNLSPTALKTASDKITHAIIANPDINDDQEQVTHDDQDEEATIDIGHHIAAASQALDDDQLTDEEKAVQDYHQKHGQNQPTRDRPTLPSDANSKTTSPTPPSPTPLITELTLPELKHHSQTNNASAAEHLILVVTRDEHHWGHVDGKPRTFPSFLEFLNDTSGLPSSSLSIAILTTSPSAYTSYISTLATHPIAKSQVILYTPSTPEDPGPQDRHDPSYQSTRRKQIATARNILLHRALAAEPHIFFYDADVVSSSPDICAQMLHQASTPNFTTSPNITLPDPMLPVGLITARAREDSNPDYDLNAWSHSGPVRKSRQLHMNYLTSVTLSSEIFPLDAVGGVLLYIKAELVRQGLSFPWWYVIGTDWDKENGDDGIETEGICYLAERLGWGCWGLGGDWHVVHQS